MRHTMLAICFLYSSVSYSQIKKHEWLAGGSGSFQTASYGPNTRMTSYTLAPDFGYFIINNLALGLGLDYVHTNTEGADKNHFFTVSPFVRYYALAASKKVNVFLQIAYQHYTIVINNPPYPSSTNYMHGYDIKAGPSIFLNSHVALEITFDYRKTGEGTYATKVFSSGVGFQIHLGSLKKKSMKE